MGFEILFEILISNKYLQENVLQITSKCALVERTRWVHLHKVMGAS
jgi:hypothetical protein